MMPIHAALIVDKREMIGISQKFWHLINVDVKPFRVDIIATIDMFNKKFSELSRFIMDTHPARIVAPMTTYGLAVKEINGSLVMPNHSISQPQIEFFVGCLSSIEKINSIHLPNDTEIHECVVLLNDMFQLHRIIQFEECNSDTSNRALGFVKLAAVQARVSVRNWAQPEHVIGEIKKIYDPLDGLIQAETGMSWTDVHGILFALTSSIEAAIIDHNKDVVSIPVSDHSAIAKMMAKHASRNEEDWLEANIDSPISAVRSYAYNQMFEATCRLMTTSAKRLAELAGTSELRTQGLLNRLSFKLGTHVDPIKLMADNHTWSKPLLELDADTFFCACPPTIWSHIHRVIYGVLPQGVAYDVISKCRANYLESELESILKETFGADNVFRSLEWNYNCEEGESDVVVILDEAILIFEAKSSRINECSIFGSKDEIKKVIESTIIHASRQASRFEEAVKHCLESGDNFTFRNDAVVIRPSENKIIVKRSITLDDFFFMAGIDGIIRDSGMIASNERLSLFMNINDLRCVLDLLDNKILVVDYLLFRDSVSKDVCLHTTELDMLGRYLDGKLNDFSEFKANALVSDTESSQKINAYYALRDIGLAAQKPSITFGIPVQKALHELSNDQPTGWLKIGLNVLDDCRKKFLPKLTKQRKKRLSSLDERLTRERDRDWRNRKR